MGQTAHLAARGNGRQRAPPGAGARVGVQLSPDMSIPVHPTQALVVFGALVMGCAGPGGESPGDAREGDGLPADAPVALDAPIDADPATIVRVQVFGIYPDPSTPRPDTRVLFHDPDGRLVGDAWTDADGRAAAPMPAGGAVTAVYSAGATRLLTITNVRPGEPLRFTGPEHDSLASPGRVHVSFPAVPGDVEYRVTAPCTHATSRIPSMDVRIMDDCVTDTMDIAVIATDRSSHTVVAASQRRAVPAVPDSSVELPPLLPPHVVPQVVRQVPAGVSRCDFHTTSTTGWVSLFESFRTLRAPGDHAFDLPFPDGLVAEMDEQELTCIFDVPALSPQVVYSKLQRARSWPVDPAGPPIDAAQFPPQVWPPSLSNGLVTWTLPPGAEAIDLQAVSVRVTAVADPQAVFFWEIILPPGVTHYALPGLPAPLRLAWNPETPKRMQLRIFDADIWQGYHDTLANMRFPKSDALTLRGVPHVIRESGQF